MHGYYLCILVMDKLTLSVNRGNRNSILQIWNVILSIYSVEVLEVPCLIKSVKIILIYTHLRPRRLHKNLLVRKMKKALHWSELYLMVPTDRLLLLWHWSLDK